MNDPRAIPKRAAARAAVGQVQPGDIVALGSGSTVSAAIELLGTQSSLAGTLKVVAASAASEKEATRAGLRLVPLASVDRFHLMLDGADEVAPDLNLIKGGGGALFREKLLARISDKLLIMVDDSKLVRRMGDRSPLPLEVIPFAVPVTARLLEARSLRPRLRMARGSERAPNPQPFVTDNGNHILDVALPELPEDLHEFDEDLRSLPGVVETGLFLGLTHRVYVGFPDGRVEVLKPREPVPRLFPNPTAARL